MIKWAHRISTVLTFAIGVLHTAGTFAFYERLSEPSLWFAGSGLCFIFVALLNLGLWSPAVSVLSRRSAAGANFLFFFWLAAGVSATPELAQVIVAGVGATMVTTAALVTRRSGS